VSTERAERWGERALVDLRERERESVGGSEREREREREGRGLRERGLPTATRTA
jgi:hypothetical protein